MKRRLAFFLVVAGALRSEQITISILATTDLHGNVYPVDYATGRPVARGLAKVATLIRAARAENPNTLLIDCGDTIQGTPLEYVHQTSVRSGTAGRAQDPMMAVMNRLGYAAMAVGNHEFNFGLKNLEQARSGASFPWLSANTIGGERPFAPYIVKTIAGVKIAVIGVTTPAVPTWEKPENLGSYRFVPPVDAVRKAVAELRAQERPDVLLAAAHSGLDGEPSENVVRDLAVRVPELDAILFGHSHRELAGLLIGKVLVVQPKNWGVSLARIDFTVDRAAANGQWSITAKKSRLIPVTKETPAAADILEIAKPYHERAERYLNAAVAEAPRDLESALGRVEDTPLVDAVHQAQLFYSKADVSFTALFNPSVKIPKGRATVRQIAAIYPYDNELYVIEGNGKMVKDALENAARYYLSCDGARCAEAPLTNRAVMAFNYDMAEGVEYEVDLSRPAGDRIHNLRRHGKPLAPDEPLRIAINNYRAAGSAGYAMFKGARIVWRSGEEIRDMMVRYYSERKMLPDTATGNWRILPEAARETLRKEALAAAARPQSQ